MVLEMEMEMRGSRDGRTKREGASGEMVVVVVVIKSSRKRCSSHQRGDDTKKGRGKKSGLIIRRRLRAMRGLRLRIWPAAPAAGL